VFKVRFGRLTLKIYDKGERVLRIELIVNNTAELRCGKALLILREKVLKPVLAGICRPNRGRPPKKVHPLDLHYQALQRQMLSTLQYLKLAA